MYPFNRFTSLMAAAGAADPGAGGGGLPPVVQPIPDPALARMQQELARQKAELDRMRSTVMAAPAAPPSASPSPDQHKELVKEFNRDPISMTAAIADRAAREVLSRQGAPGFETQVEMAKQLARGQDPVQQARWDKYYGEIEARMANVDPQFRSNTTLWNNAYRMVVGEHLNDIITEASAAAPKGPALHLSTESGPAVPSKSAPSTGGATKITPEEQKVARKFHLTDEQYLAGKKANLEQSDQILSPTGPSSWDEHITFSTRDKLRKEREARRAAHAKK